MRIEWKIKQGELLREKRAENYDDIIEGLKYMLDEQLDVTSDYSKSFIERTIGAKCTAFNQ